jgi:hypothetical protein
MPMKWAEAFAEFSSQMKHLAPAALVPAWSRVKPSAAHDHVYYLMYASGQKFPNTLEFRGAACGARPRALRFHVPCLMVRGNWLLRLEWFRN